MEYFWFTKLLMLTQLLYITDGLTVSPEQHLSNGNCSGKNLMSFYAIALFTMIQ